MSTELAELQQLASQPEISGMSKLRLVLSKCPHLDLSDSVYGISQHPCKFGGYSDVFSGYSISRDDGKGVKVSIKRLRINIMDDARLQKVISLLITLEDAQS